MTACPCDILVHPRAPQIGAGLTSIPRQTALFADFRRALLSSIGSKPALSQWDPGPDGDLGTMLVEMWAYLCDSLSFYDETIAHEVYIRTARQRASVRKLVELLGYIPRPAVGASVDLALLAEGRKPITLPVGAAFRSGAFDNEPPQIFEIARSAAVHPLTNKWELVAPRPETLGVDAPSSLLLVPGTANVEEGDIVLVATGNDASTSIATVNATAEHTGADGESYVRVDLEDPLPVAASTPVTSIQLLKPEQTGGLNLKGSDAIRSRGTGFVARRAPVRLQQEVSLSIDTLGYGGPDNSISGSSITLNGLYRQIRPGNYILLADGDDLRWFQVRQNREVDVEAGGGDSYTVGSETVTVPKVYSPVTQLVLDADVNDGPRRAAGTSSWESDSDAAGRVTLHYGMAKAGSITVERKTRIQNGDPLNLSGVVEQPDDHPEAERILLEDYNGDGLLSDGSVDFPQRSVALDPDTDLGRGLLSPANVFANVVTATRGETVRDEVLGSGDASAAGQSFALKKSPLTYLSAPKSNGGIASTLQVRVDGVLWKEVPTFYGQGSTAQVFIVRQDDDGASNIIFGDGVRGSRLPTGTSNVTATYRHGAGSAAPPIGSITQMAKPVKGITEVRNPVAAHGGDDAEKAENIRMHAPASALILGRAVSIQDMEAVAARESGVRAVKAGWTWHSRRQRPVAFIRYIGEEGIEETVSAAVRGVSDPSTPISVEAATAVPLHLVIDVVVDDTFVEDDVLEGVSEALISAGTGFLSPERVGIGAPLFRSGIFEAVLDVDGADAVHGLQYMIESAETGTAPGLSMPTRQMRYQPSLEARSASFFTRSTAALRQFAEFTLNPGEGAYFDLESGSLVLNGWEATGG